MKIVILHYAAPPVIGGVEQVIYYHSTLLAQDGYDVHVVAGRGEKFDDRVQFHCREIVDSRHPDILAMKEMLDRGEMPEAFPLVRDQILDELAPILDDTDALIAHNIIGLHKNLPLTAALRSWVEEKGHPKLIAWHHDLAWKASRYLSEMHNGYPWDLLRQQWPNTDHVAVSEARRLDVANLFQVPIEDVRVVPGGVDIYSFLKLQKPVQQLIRKLDLVETEPWLLLPARVTRRKNIELALQITAELRKHPFPRIRLLVTGPPGPHNPDNLAYFRELKEMRDELGLRGSAHFLAEELGEAPDTETIIALYQIADALLYPSFEEGFGLPILEAALLRLPIFCSDIPPLRELAGGRATYFAPDGNPALIAGLIARVLGVDRAAMLRRRVLNRYDWRQIVRKHVEPLLYGEKHPNGH